MQSTYLNIYDVPKLILSLNFCAKANKNIYQTVYLVSLTKQIDKMIKFLKLDKLLYHVKFSPNSKSVRKENTKKSNEKPKLSRAPNKQNEKKKNGLFSVNGNACVATLIALQFESFPPINSISNIDMIIFLM